MWQPAYLFADTGMHVDMPDDILFVEPWIYRWGLRFERSVAAWYVGRADQATSDTQAVLATPTVREPWLTHAKQNLSRVST
jgi:hypothetical protein